MARKSPDDMCATDPAGIHYFSFWESRADNEAVPLWLRIVARAYSQHSKNGHAPHYLGGESTLTDILKKSRQHLQNEIRRAIEFGFLAAESNVNCLVLPDEICGGVKGNARAECKLHTKTSKVSA